MSQYRNAQYRNVSGTEMSTYHVPKCLSYRNVHVPKCLRDRNVHVPKCLICYLVPKCLSYQNVSYQNVGTEMSLTEMSHSKIDNNCSEGLDEGLWLMAGTGWVTERLEFSKLVEKQDSRHFRPKPSCTTSDL